MKLSILIPAYNEENTIEKVVQKVLNLSLPSIQKEIIIIDDGSSDRTPAILSNIKNEPGVKLLRHKYNKGKGRAIQSGLKKATGEIIIIQDADLEYDSKDIPKLIKPILDNKFMVVYGTRLRTKPILLGKNKTPFLLHFFGNKFLSLVTSILYGSKITDMETGYKAMSKAALKNIKLKSRSFDFEPEITAKLMKAGYRILEVDIKTKPRGYEEGKKIRPIKDGAMAMWTLVKYRFID